MLALRSRFFASPFAATPRPASSSQADAYRRVRHLCLPDSQGATPANMPVEFASKINLVINLATAEALGLTIPPNYLMIADELKPHMSAFGG